MNTRFARHRRALRALTLTELLVVLAIIGLLATIAIPVYTMRMETARIRTAQQEMAEIALAEEQCFIFHGFYLPFQLLDNISQDPDIVVGGSNPADTWTNEPLSQLWAIDPTQDPLIQATTNWPSPGGQASLDDAHPRIQEMLSEWQGPFLNTHRVYRNPLTQDNPSLSLTDVRRDFPLDPWGQPYRFFSPVGPIGTAWRNTDLLAMDTDSFSDGEMRADSGTDPFDKYTVVSFGPNGVFDLDVVSNISVTDDLAYEFGAVIVPTVFYRYYR